VPLLNTVGCDTLDRTANQNPFGLPLVLLIKVLSVFALSPRIVTLDEKLEPLIISVTVGGDGVPIVNNQKLGYRNIEVTLVVAVNVVAYAVPVTLIGRLNVVNVLTLRGILVLSLCIGVVNVKIPPPLILLICPPIEDITCA
jgi:hypothetical protein